MKTLKIACLAGAVFAIWTVDVSQAQAQFRSGAPLSGGIRDVRGFSGPSRFTTRGNVAARNFGNRRLRGNDSIVFGNTGHEFARTIPRVFGDPILPYFALYPPVYYSLPVARPYGFSPFALPPGVQPAEGFVGPVEPKLMKNPHYKPKKPAVEEKPGKAQTTFNSGVIVNPYFVKRSGPGDAPNLTDLPAALEHHTAAAR